MDGQSGEILMRLLFLLAFGCGKETHAPCGPDFERDASGVCVEIDPPTPAVEEETPEPPEPTDTASDTDTADPVVPPEELTPLSGPKLLRRMSLDLLGVLPTTEQLDAIEADPNMLDAWIEEALSDPRWAERLVHILGRSWHTQVDEFQLLFKEYDNLYLDDTNEYPFERSAGEEPLRLLAHVASNDLPWSEVSTADYTMANEMLASIWPLDYTGPGWQVTRYTDDRPAAGVLTTNGLWLRYYSLGTNFNRGRAAALSRLLICEDYLARPVSFAAFPSLADEDATAKALQTEPYCLGCHATLDPIAATLFGFQTVDSHNGDETGWYHPEREALGSVILEVDAAWFGQPVSGLHTLVQHMAADDRFHACAVERFTEGLWQRESTFADWEDLLALRGVYEAGDQRIRSLVKAILDTDHYRAGEADIPTHNTARLVMPDQWGSVIEDMMGFRWVWNGFDQLDNDTYGYRIMAGGVDGLQVTRPGSEPTVTGALVLQRLSEAGAGQWVERTLGSGSDVLGSVDASLQPGDPSWDAARDALFWRILARRPDAEDRAAIDALWVAVEGAQGANEAWVALISALVRHPESVHY